MPKVLPTRGGEPLPPKKGVAAAREEELKEYLLLQGKINRLQELLVLIKSVQDQESAQTAAPLPQAQAGAMPKTKAAQAGALPGKRVSKMAAAAAAPAAPTPTARKVAAAQAGAAAPGTPIDTLQQLEQEIADLEKSKGSYKDVLPLLQTILEYLQEPGKLDPSTLPQFFNALIMLQQKMGSLPPDLQKTVQAIFASLQNLKVPGTGQDLSSLLAAYIVYGWSSDYYHMTPPPNISPQDFLKEEASNYSLNTSIPFFANVSKDISSDIQSYPFVSGTSISFTLFSTNFLTALVQQLQSIPPDEMSTVVAAVKASYTQANDQLTKLSKDLTKLQNELTYNPPTTDLAYEISYLQQLISMLQQDIGSNPTIAAKLQKYQSELAAIMQKYPNLSSDDITTVQNIFNDVNTYGSQLPDNQKQAFMQTELQLFKTMISANTTNVAELQKEIDAYNTLASAEAQIKDLATLLSLIGSQGLLSPQNQQRFIEDIQSLLAEQGSLPPGTQQYITTALNYIGSLTGGSDSKSFSYSSLIGDSLIYSWTQQYEASTSSPTPDGLKAFLQQKIQQFSQNSPSDFVTNVTNELNADMKSFPAPADGQGILANFTDPNFLATLSSAMVLQPPGQGPANFLIGIANQMQTVIDNAQSSISDMTNSIKEYNALNQIYQQASDQLFHNLLWTMPLQQSFYEVILDYYMPQQESYLNSLASVLFYSNFGSSMDNSILANITGFSNAGSLYDFYNWLQVRANQGKDYYTGDPAQAQQEVEQELESLQGSGDPPTGGQIGEAESALATISAKEAEILQDEKSGKLTQAQGSKLIAELETTRSQLNAALIKMKDLAKNLSDLQFSPATTSKQVWELVNGRIERVTVYTPIPNTFVITTKDGQSTGVVLTNIQQDENTLVNGSADDGGLPAIYQGVTANQSDWSSQSQTNQMNLQLVMTEIQQEWTIVSSALTSLNQMYLTFARAIMSK